LNNAGKLTRVAVILLYITTGVGGTALGVLLTIYLCFVIGRCKNDWALPPEYDDMDSEEINFDDIPANQTENS
jgi:hypothetical protein